MRVAWGRGHARKARSRVLKKGICDGRDGRGGGVDERGCCKLERRHVGRVVRKEPEVYVMGLMYVKMASRKRSEKTHG